ncbi:unnamed protein product [Peronospora belbahrii]|uniref:AN1-type domain-containing protein n=1 Tax=Peronospora belbahrii TaxID=622444 RepID=A0ABN8D8R4_9STRA|nr:unnamed protein product [Peronospora belbahrii]
MQQEQESGELSLNGCDFFGAPGSGRMCSVCWTKTMSDRQVETTLTLPRSMAMKMNELVSVESTCTTTTTAATSNTAATSIAATTAAPSFVEEIMESKTMLLQEIEDKCVEKLVQKNKKRCWECKKKVGLTAMECRCGYVFCNSHRFVDQHPCNFDFKTADRAELARRNPGGGTFSKLEKL